MRIGFFPNMGKSNIMAVLKMAAHICKDEGIEVFLPDDLESDAPARVLKIPEGRISPWKGQHIVIEAIKDLDFVKLRIVGSANFGEDEYFNYLKKLVSDYNLQHRVEFYPFSLDIKEHLSWCNVFVHSSTSPEPFGRVVVEGMLAGRTVIATDSGGVPEIINDETIGILVPPGDVTSLNQAIYDINSNREKYKKVAMQGRKKALKEFSLPVLFANISSYIDNVK